MLHEVFSGFKKFYDINDINYKEKTEMNGSRTELIITDKPEEVLSKIENRLIVSQQAVHDRRFTRKYSNKDLKGAIDFLELLVFWEYQYGIGKVKIEHHYKERGIYSPARGKDDIELYERYGKVLKVLENLQELADLSTDKDIKSKYGSQAKVAKEKVTKIFNKASAVDRQAFHKKFKAAIKTLEVFHKRWK